MIHPANVVAAVAAVQGALGGIPKLTPKERGRRDLSGGTEGGPGRISYAYRGVDQIAAAVQPLFAEYGVVCAPRVLSYDVEHVEVAGRPWRHVTMKVEWTVYGPGGPADRLEPIVTVGEARDNSDKAANKAQTAAYKNLLLRLLAIGDPADDPDNEPHETDPDERQPAPLDPAIVALWRRVLFAVGRDEHAAELRDVARSHDSRLTQANLAHNTDLAASIGAVLDRFDTEDADAAGQTAETTDAGIPGS